MQLDDAALVEAAKAGDRFAVDQLLRRHYDRIHAVTSRIAGRSRDADDACQEALIKIVRNLPRFDGRSSFGTWAYRIATNAALDELRKRKRRPDLTLVDDRDDPGGVTVDPVDELGSKRIDAVADRLAIDEALEDVDEDFRIAVVLRDVGDLDYAEIAEVLDIPVGTVKSRIARGRKQLAERLRLDELPPAPDGPEPRGTVPGSRTDAPAGTAFDVTSDPSTDSGNRHDGSERPTEPT